MDFAKMMGVEWYEACDLIRESGKDLNAAADRLLLNLETAAEKPPKIPGTVIIITI